MISCKNSTVEPTPQFTGIPVNSFVITDAATERETSTLVPIKTKKLKPKRKKKPSMNPSDFDDSTNYCWY